MKISSRFICLILILLALFSGCGHDDSDEISKKKRQPATTEKTDIAGIQEVGTYSFSGFAAVAIHVIGNYAYIADQAFGIRIINVSIAKEPSEVSNYRTKGPACGIYVIGKFAYATDDKNLYILDISDPTNPKEISIYSSCGSGVFVVGNYAYFTAGGGAGIISIIDISNPKKPYQVVGQGGGASHTRSLYIIGNRAYISRDHADNWLKIIDISDPKNPQQIGFSRPGGDGLYVAGKYAYMAADSGLVIFDISDPKNPTIVGQRDTLYTATSVFVSGKYTYITANVAGLYVIDISDPKKPQIVKEQKTTRAMDVFVVNNYIYIADGEGGLRILKYS